MGKTYLNDDANECTPILGEEQRWTDCFPARYALAILGFFGIFNVYAMRVNLSVALVAMVRELSEPKESAIACSELLPLVNSSHIDPGTRHTGEFDWDSNTQGHILGAFFYGYVITQIPGGIIAEKFGAKWLFGIGVLVTGIFTLLTPLAARWSVPALMAARVIEGLGEGVTFPAMNALIGRWVPKSERSRIATIIFSGSPMGTVVAMAASGVLSDSTFLGGWPSVFYVFGGVTCIWFLFWIFLVYETPAQHPRISKAELAFITGELDPVTTNKSIPWRSILTSGPVWALTITHFGYNWGFYTLLTELPTYLSNVLHFKLKKNGTLSALPYLLQAMLAFIASFLADKMRASARFKITTIRKVINSIAFFGPGLIVLSVAFVGCNPTILVALLTISVGLNGFMYSGFNITHVDMSPELAGTLMGITNCVANLSGFLAPLFVGWAIQDGQTLHNWGIVFITTSVIYFVTGLVYNIFASAEPQPWGITQSSTTTTKA